jgi:sugar lactone lactonase YvrE
LSNLSDFLGGSGGGLKPFNDLGTVTGVVDLDVSAFGSFRVKQGAGAITLNVTGKAADTAGYVDLFFYPNFEEAVTISGADLIENGYAAATGNMNALNYNNVSFSVSAQDTSTNDIAFNNDGSKMYMVGYANKTVFQYTLSTPFDLSTASYDNVSFDVNAQDTRPYGIAFNNDGSKMYMVGVSSVSVHQYTLSTPFDLSTASYDSVSFSVAAQDTLPHDIAFNSDGSKMYMVGRSNDSVYQYTLSTPFDLSTASYDNVSFSFSAQDTSPYGIAFNNNGSKMYMVGYANKTVFQYTLSTPFDLSTASYDNVSFDVAAQDTSPLGIAFNNDGSKLYIVGNANDSVFQYSPTYDLGPLFLYQIIHTGTAATFNTLTADYTIEVAT